MEVVQLDDAAAKSRLCDEVLRALPDWFGLEQSVRDYVRDVAGLPFFAVGRDGFLALKLHDPAAAEVYVMGVLPDRHRHGVGSALMDAGETFLRERGVEYLQAKTLGPSRPDEHYAATRRFYESRGFRPLEETTAFWGEENPCLIMVKRL